MCLCEFECDDVVSLLFSLLFPVIDHISVRHLTKSQKMRKRMCVCVCACEFHRISSSFCQLNAIKFKCLVDGYISSFISFVVIIITRANYISC